MQTCYFLFFFQFFQKMFGEEFLENVYTEDALHPSVERPETRESTSVLLEARGIYIEWNKTFRIEVNKTESHLKKKHTFLSPVVELYGNLLQVKERIEQEHYRLSQLQALLRADGNKVKMYTSVDITHVPVTY